MASTMRNSLKLNDPDRLESLASLSALQISQIDPLRLNLAVARGCPASPNWRSIASPRWSMTGQTRSDSFSPRPRPSSGIDRLTGKTTSTFSRLGLLCWFLDEVQGIRYRDDHREKEQVVYTDPGDSSCTVS